MVSMCYPIMQKSAKQYQKRDFKHWSMLSCTWKELSKSKSYYPVRNHVIQCDNVLSNAKTYYTVPQKNMLSNAKTCYLTCKLVRNSYSYSFKQNVPNLLQVKLKFNRKLALLAFLVHPRQKVRVRQPWNHLKSSIWYRLQNHDNKQDLEVLKIIWWNNMHPKIAK